MLVPVLCVSVMESTPQSAATAKQEMRVTLVGTGGVRWISRGRRRSGDWFFKTRNHSIGRDWLLALLEELSLSGAIAFG